MASRVWLARVREYEKRACVRVPHNERLTRDLDFRWLVKNLVTPDRYGKGLGPAQMIDRRVCICTNAQQAQEVALMCRCSRGRSW